MRTDLAMPLWAERNLWLQLFQKLIPIKACDFFQPLSARLLHSALKSVWTWWEEDYWTITCLNGTYICFELFVGSYMGMIITEGTCIWKKIHIFTCFAQSVTFITSDRVDFCTCKCLLLPLQALMDKMQNEILWWIMAIYIWIIYIGHLWCPFMMAVYVVSWA